MPRPFHHDRIFNRKRSSRIPSHFSQNTGTLESAKIKPALSKSERQNPIFNAHPKRMDRPTLADNHRQMPALSAEKTELSNCSKTLEKVNVTDHRDKHALI